MSTRIVWISLRVALGFTLGAGMTGGVFQFLLGLSQRALPPEGSEGTFVTVSALLPGLVPAAVAVLVLRSLPRWRGVGFAMLAGNAVTYLLLLCSVFANPISPAVSLGPPGPKASLLIAIPPARPASGGYVGLSHFTAAELNRIRHGWDLRQITYVPADVPSTDPLVVSVNPIDEYTWGAAALSPRGRCYLILVVLDRTDPQYGETRYGWFPDGRPCLGAAATPATVTDARWPDLYY